MTTQIILLIGVFVDVSSVRNRFVRQHPTSPAKAEYDAWNASKGNATLDPRHIIMNDKAAMEEVINALSHAGFFSVPQTDKRGNFAGLFIQIDEQKNPFGECTLLLDHDEDDQYAKEQQKIDAVFGLAIAQTKAVLNFMKYDTQMKYVPNNGCH